MTRRAFLRGGEGVLVALQTTAGVVTPDLLAFLNGLLAIFVDLLGIDDTAQRLFHSRDALAGPRGEGALRAVQGVVDVRGAFIDRRVLLTHHEFQTGLGEDGALVLAGDRSGVVVSDA
ncbi:hypothetical protein [Streptomyces chartreusis]|uniref:hypothetical protein n=1 Tax=Streptomyces chartreusis TaxID=1969 RepID=UPI003660196C